MNNEGSRRIGLREKCTIPRRLGEASSSSSILSVLTQDC